jgi:2-aminoadipate transaminase
MTIPYPLSHRATHIKRSVMRDLIALANRPDIISFAGGLPAADCLPLAQVKECAEAVLTRDGSRALQYGPPYAPLREWIAGYMQQRGVPCAVENVYITNGAQQGLELTARLLLDEDTPAVLEALTFTGIGQAIGARTDDIRTAPVDLQTGVDVDAFDAALARGPRPRLGVVIPAFHNPLGVSLPREKRLRLAEAAARYGVPLLEDDPYSALRFEGEDVLPIKAYDEAGMVIYNSSFSKILAPAMRLGWLVAPAEVIAKLTVLREAIDLESSQLTQRIAAEFLQRGYLAPHLKRLNAVNHERRDALFAALERELGSLADWTEPQGGLFVWVTLPAGADTGAMFQAAIEHNVAYIPGAHFSPNGPGPANTLRLNYSNAVPERIHEGVHQLAEVVKEHLAVIV